MLELLAISGSTRSPSSNTALLEALQVHAPSGIRIQRYPSVRALPIFCPDLEGDKTPEAVLEFCRLVAAADGIVISSPEYVRAIPGGLKNAIDWLVSRDEIIHKPIALLHASHRGEDMLVSLRTVLGTVSDCFTADVFVRFSLMSKTNAQIDDILAQEDSVLELQEYLMDFRHYIARNGR